MVEVTANEGKGRRFSRSVTKSLDILCESISGSEVSQNDKVKSSLAAENRKSAKGGIRRYCELRNAINHRIKIDSGFCRQSGKRDSLGKVTRGSRRVSLRNLKSRQIRIRAPAQG